MDEFDDLEDFDEVLDFDASEIKNNLENYDSEKLCEIIICYRYLGLHKDLSVSCMEELAKRRINGNSFNFEEFIDKSMSDLPKLDFKVLDITTIINQLGKGLIK